jgi:hypothetical protein
MSKAIETTLAVIQNDIGYIKCEIVDIKSIIATKYVTKDEFEPIKKVVYGLVSVILLAVVAAVITLILK